MHSPSSYFETKILLLPDSLLASLGTADTAALCGPVRLHVSSLPEQIGVDGFASDGQIWISPSRFSPHTCDGLRLIGHELAHLLQQRAMPATADAPQLLDDAMLEAAADSFGAAFAEAAPRDAVWLRAPGPATSPRGVVQCSGGRPQHVLNLRNQVLQDDFEEDEDEDEEDEVDQPMQGPSGAKSMATTNSGTAKSIAGPTRTVIGVGVSATNTVSSVLGGTGIAGGITGALSAGAAAAMAPAAMVLGPVGIAMAVADIALSAVSAASTYAHMIALEEIVRRYKGRSGVRDSTLEAIAFTLNKKNKKLKRKGLGCIPILGSICNTVYTLGRSMQKRYQGTRGVERRAYAKTLWGNMLAGDPAAIAACDNLLGIKTFTRIRNCIDGDVVLKKKMKSL
jgi:hypothetical protein